MKRGDLFMRTPRPFPAFTALILFFLAIPARGEELSFTPTINSPESSTDDADKKTEAPPAVSLDEYNRIPVGLLAQPDTSTKTTLVVNTGKAALPQALGQIPGLFPIPGVTGTGEGDLSFEQILKNYRDGKYDIVFKNIEPMIAIKHHEAEQLLGIMYLNGQGVQKNAQKALDLLTRAAEANQPMAQHYLGVMYFTGQGVDEPDSVHALMWLQIAILHYPEGPEKTRARQDRDSVYSKMSRLEKSRAMQSIHDWLDQRGESHLMDKIDAETQ
jgi:hypothetical protein